MFKYGDKVIITRPGFYEGTQAWVVEEAPDLKGCIPGSDHAYFAELENLPSVRTVQVRVLLFGNNELKVV